MKNIMEIEGQKAVIAFDPDIEMFRGEFIGLNGGADFYAKDVEGLAKEGAISLRIFLEECETHGIDPKKTFSGKFNLRTTPELHENASIAAEASGKSLNQWIIETLNEAVHQ
jgi:predicted HicB family RNase H-like nuclease